MREKEHEVEWVGSGKEHGEEMEEGKNMIQLYFIKLSKHK